jgi:ribosomal-protein-alanine acetyltransferase
MKFSIRMMQERDLPAVVAIENSWSYLSKWGIPGFRSALSDPYAYYCLVAEVIPPLEPPDAATLEVAAPDNPATLVLAGFAVLGLRPDHGELCDIVVPPQFLFQGVGQAMLNRCFDLSLERQLPVLFLEVRQSNQRAIQFYKKNGFEIISIRKHYYANPQEDAWIMRRKWSEGSQP